MELVVQPEALTGGGGIVTCSDASGGVGAWDESHLARKVYRRASAVVDLSSERINVVRDALLACGGARSSALVGAPVNLTERNMGSVRKAVATRNVLGTVGLLWVDWRHLGGTALKAVAVGAKTSAIVVGDVWHDDQLAERAALALTEEAVGVHDTGALGLGSVGAERALTSAVLPLSVGGGLAVHGISFDSLNWDSEDQWLCVLAPGIGGSERSIEGINALGGVVPHPLAGLRHVSNGLFVERVDGVSVASGGNLPEVLGIGLGDHLLDPIGAWGHGLVLSETSFPVEGSFGGLASGHARGGEFATGGWLSKETSGVNLPHGVLCGNLNSVNDNVGEQTLVVGGIGPSNDVQRVVFIQVHGYFGSDVAVLSIRTSWEMSWFGEDVIGCGGPFAS